MSSKKIPYLIAETAYSFEGDAKYLLEQTKALPVSINAIKYHMLFDIEEYMTPAHSVFDLLTGWMLSKTQWDEILLCAKNKGHDVIVLADDIESIRYLTEKNNLIDGVEVHAACINDKELLDSAINFAKKFDKTLYLGISGFEIQELCLIIEHINSYNLDKVVLMYGFQNYPTKIEEVRLAKIPIIKDMFNLPVGYADHTKYDDPCKDRLISTAYCLGANIQEVHYVINEGEKRTDAITALSVLGLERIQNMLKENYTMIGNADFRLNQGEKNYLNFRKVPAFAEDFAEGHVIKKEDICYIRIENPKYQHAFDGDVELIGKELLTSVNKHQEITFDIIK